MRRFISTLTVIAVIFTMIPNMYSVYAYDEDITFDFSAFEKYGAYIYSSSDGDEMKGINILSHDDTKSYDNRLYHYFDDKAYIDANSDDTDLSGAYAKLVSANSDAVVYEYFTRRQDGAWMYKTIGGKDAFFTTKNVRNRDGSSMVSNGCMYFQITDDLISEIDSNLTFVVEYFDIGTNDITFSYCNTGFKNDGNYSTSAFKITTTDTNTWKTKVVSVTDAKMDKSWNKTALGNGTASIKVQGMRSDYYISKLMIIPTDTYNNIINPPTGDELNMDKHNDGVNWWNLAKTKGVYLDAADTSNGINGYNTPVSQGESIDGIKKNAFVFSDFAYFSVNSDKITQNDNDLYLVFEYLDYDSNMGQTQNSNGTFSFSNQSKISVNVAKTNGSNMLIPWFNRHNTNTWKTVAIPVSSACFSNTNTATGLGDGKQHIRINANGVKTLISRIGVVKKSDIPSSNHIYYAPENVAHGPTLWVAGDSLSESVDKADSYPREGWAMEFGNFFINETLSDAGNYYYDSDGNRTVTKVNNGVTVVNLARGGKSTRSFLNQTDPTVGPAATDTRWDEIKQNAKRGDYLFVSFCINDVGNRTTVQTNPYLVGDVGDRFSHRANIKEFKNECDKLGVNLVLVTPAVGRGLGDGQDAHIASLHAQGMELGVPVLDMRTYHKALVEALKAGSNQSEYPHDKSKLIFNHILDSDINAEYNAAALGTQDNTHVNQTGAKELCKIIINEITSKSDQYPSLSQLSQWIDTSKDTTPMAVPVKQNEHITYEIADAKFIVDDVESNTYAPGQVKAKVTVTNASDAERKVVLYTAVYDHTQDLEVASATTPVTLTPGQSITLTSDALTLPETEGYTFKRFVWDSDMAPYKEDDGKVVLLAEGYNRRAVLTWKTKANLGNVTFKLYRDDELIATTQNYGFIDDGVERGTHKYQLNCYNANGELIYQTAYSVVNVSSIYDVGLDKNVLYTKANVNSVGETDDINCGIKNRATGYIVPSVEAEAHFGTISNADYKKSPYVGSSNTDGDIRRVLVTDSMGISKYAWNTNDYFAKNRGASGAAQNGSIYIDKVNTTDLTVDDTKLTIFVEFLGDVNQLKLQYTSTTVGSNGYYTVKDIIPDQTKISNGEWRVAKYVITDAYCGEGGDGANHPLGDKSPLRFHSGNQDIYISSVMIVKDAQGINPDTIYAKLNNLDYNNRVVRDATSKYADGVSITFEGGQPHGNGMAVYPELSRNSLPDCSGEFGVAEDGTGYYATYDRGSQTNLYVSVDKDYVFGASDRNLVLEVTYKADYDTNLNVVIPRYYKDSDSSSGGNSQTSYPIYKNETDNWQTIKINLDDAGIMGATDNRAIEFRLNIPYVAGRQLKVSRIAVKNADHLPAKYIQ